MKLIKTKLLCTLILPAITCNTYSMKREHQAEQTTKTVQKQSLSRELLDIVALIISQDEPIQLLLTNFEFDQLLPELKAHVIELLTTMSTATTLEEIAGTINALAQTNKELNTLINDPHFCMKLIKHLAQTFKCSDEKAAESLNVPQARNLLEIQKKFLIVCQEDNFDKQEFHDLYEEYKKYVDLNFTYLFQAYSNVELTLLMQATLNNDCSAIQTILDLGADVNKTDSAGETALMVSAVAGKTNAVECLLSSSDIHVDQQTILGYTALMAAAKYNHYLVIQLLLNNKADINKTNVYGKTALIAAVDHECIDAVKCLLHNTDIKINQQSKDGETALMIAVNTKNKSIIKLLLDAGADPEIAASDGFTPLELAKLIKDPEIIDLIQDAIKNLEKK